MSDKTFGGLFWHNVSEMLKENNKNLNDIAKFMTKENEGKRVLALYDKLYRHSSQEINPMNVLGAGVYEYLLRFDKYLMVSDLYSDRSEYDAEI